MFGCPNYGEFQKDLIEFPHLSIGKHKDGNVDMSYVSSVAKVIGRYHP